MDDIVRKFETAEFWDNWSFRSYGMNLIGEEQRRAKMKIRNCKCCGSEAKLESLFDHVFVCCKNDMCLVSGPHKSKAEEAIFTWNHLHAAVSLSISFDDDADPVQMLAEMTALKENVDKGIELIRKEIAHREFIDSLPESED